MFSSLDGVPRSVKDALHAANAAAGSRAAHSFNTIYSEIASAFPNNTLPPSVKHVMDSARVSIKTTTTESLTALYMCFSDEFRNMSNEYELCITEMKKQHEIRIALIEAENKVLKLKMEGQKRTLDLLKDIEKNTRNVRPRILEEVDRSNGQRVSGLPYETEKAVRLRLLQEEQREQAEGMKRDTELLRLQVEQRAHKFSEMIAKKKAEEEGEGGTDPPRDEGPEPTLEEEKTPAVREVKEAAKPNQAAANQIAREIEPQPRRYVVKVGKEVQKLGVVMKIEKKSTDQGLEQGVVVADVKPSCVFHGLINLGDKLVTINGTKITSASDIGQFANQDRLFQFETRVREDESTTHQKTNLSPVKPTLFPQASQQPRQTPTAIAPIVPDEEPLNTAPAIANSTHRLQEQDAFQYLATVRNKFPQDPRVYELFLDIMNHFKAEKITADQAIRQVRTIFKGYNDLILGFNMFLPDKHKISLKDLEGETGL